RLGGFADLPIMEDFELVRRLCRSGNIVTLPERALTSSRRWRKLGVLKTMMINQRLILNYALRRPPEELLRLYGREKGVSSI
ncbi:MAG: glycosyltransferase, partial [Verrucomicrobia bacterium]|nr:glycosyltransferase [Verrucomicrobiota bacterium]